jgi:hypothetical protein
MKKNEPQSRTSNSIRVICRSCYSGKEALEALLAELSTMA